MFLCHLIDKPQKGFRRSIRESFVLDESYKQKLKAAAFSHLVLKSNIFKKIKYAQKKEILGIFNIRKRMLIRFVDFEISNHKRLYVRISVIGTTVPVSRIICPQNAFNNWYNVFH